MIAEGVPKKVVQVFIPMFVIAFAALMTYAMYIQAQIYHLIEVP